MQVTAQAAQQGAKHHGCIKQHAAQYPAQEVQRIGPESTTAAPASKRATMNTICILPTIIDSINGL